MLFVCIAVALNDTHLISMVLANELEFTFMLKMHDKYFNITCDSISPTETEAFQTGRVSLKGAF